jgi:hypothetical protein
MAANAHTLGRTSFCAITLSFACGTSSTQDNKISPPTVGTYTTCARGIETEGATSGFEGSASLTISAGSTDSGVTATYTDNHGVTSSFDLEAIGAAAGQLTSNATVTSYAQGLCAGSSSKGLPTLPTPYPATLSLMSGTMLTASGTAFLAATGTLAGQDGSCSLSTPETYWIVCSDGPDSAPPTESSGTSTFTAGTYQCASAVDVDQQDPMALADQSSSGTLSLAADGTKVSIDYEDVYLSGKLAFDVTSATTAVAVAGQNLSSQCTDYSMVPPAQLIPNTFPITAASLVVVGSTVFLSYTGNSSESSGGSGSAMTTCPAASLAGTVVCTMGS